MHRTDHWRVLTELMSDRPATCDRLIAEHLPSITGRCTACTIPWTGMPGAIWPCTMHNLATAARALHELRDRQ